MCLEEIILRSTFQYLTAFQNEELPKTSIQAWERKMKYPDLLFVLLLLCLSMFEMVLKLLYMITGGTLMRKCFP